MEKNHATRFKPTIYFFIILITVPKEQGIDRKRKITSGLLNLSLIVSGSWFIKELQVSTISTTADLLRCSCIGNFNVF